MTTILAYLLSPLSGVFVAWIYFRFRKGTLKQIGLQIIQQAKNDAALKLKEARLCISEEKLESQKKQQALWEKERKLLLKQEERLKNKEDHLDKQIKALDQKLSAFKKDQQKLRENDAAIHSLREQLKEKLEIIAGLSSAQAKEELFHSLKNDAAMYEESLLKEVAQTAEHESKKLIATSLNRLAASCASHGTTEIVSLPKEELKARIVGREGRNIRTLEHLTGVNFLLDETPGVVVICCFDPMRRQIAKMALEELVSDGRIHPTRIKEAVERAASNAEKLILKRGEAAAIKAGAPDLHPELQKLLGALSLRTSVGQNIIEHSLEVSNICGLMAEELGLNRLLAKRIGLLHDIGKAVSHDVKGTHALIGRDLALKYGESEAVANGIGCHHDEIPPATIEASLCNPADTLSAARPGARVEAIEESLQRIKLLEDLAMRYRGVENAYALQAGRELRVSIVPEVLCDLKTGQLAKDLAEAIEKEIQISGKIKISLVRQKEFVHFAN